MTAPSDFPDDLPAELRDLEAALSRRLQPLPPAELRGRTLAAVGGQLSRGARADRWWFAAGLGVLFLLGANVALTAPTDIYFYDYFRLVPVANPTTEQWRDAMGDLADDPAVRRFIFPSSPAHQAPPVPPPAAYRP